MGFFRKLRIVFASKWLWINLAAVALLAVILLWWTGGYLNRYTGHGESVTVPTLKGMTIEEAEQFLRDKPLSLFILDSIYNPELKPGEIINQNPDANSKVKEGRRIYLTIRSYEAEQETVPDVEGISLRNAVSKLKNAGFIVGELIYRPYKYRNAVLHVSYKGDKVIAGTSFPKGTTLDLVVGTGLGDTRIEVPNLLGNTLPEAEVILLGGYSLNIGNATYDGHVQSKRDTVTAVIFKQDPAPGGELRVGEFVHVSLTTRDNFNKAIDAQLDSLGGDYEEE
jgi:eukaryotic-like serine/threonine-protein kinase